MMTKTISNGTWNLAAAMRSWLLLVALCCSSAILAQGVLSGSQTGTIEGMHQGDGYLTISGRDYGFQNGVTEVYYDGERRRTNFMNEGLVVRFLVNRDGVLTRIEVLGPVNQIEALVES